MTSRNARRWTTQFLLWLCVVFMVGGCGDSSAPIAEEKPAIDRHITSTTNDWALLARSAILQNKLTALSDSCLKLDVNDQGAKELVEVTVKEIHNVSCGGDPNTEPRLFTIHIDRQTNAISSDALSEDSEFLPLK